MSAFANQTRPKELVEFPQPKHASVILTRLASNLRSICYSRQKNTCEVRSQEQARLWLRSRVFHKATTTFGAHAFCRMGSNAPA
jgi:hypothetical protein